MSASLSCALWHACHFGREFFASDQGHHAIAGSWNTQFPEIIGVLFTFDDTNNAPRFDCFPDLIHSIEDCRIDVLDAFFPAAFVVWLFKPKPQLAIG